ncbi:glyoxalase [Rouxiella sp. T17]|uniref:glyoxalase n=1 Tax=Rouxiella sp. T17 TaxID=3085684 RepID=UPI002FCC31EC
MNSQRRHISAFTLSSMLFIAAPFASWADNQPVAVGAQYDTTHVYVQPGKMDAFVDSILKTFGGTVTKRVNVDVTPTPSQTWSQLILTPAGGFSVFDFTTPAPYPFGQERNGFLVKDLDSAIAQAKQAGADVLVEPFNDPIGRDAVIQWPGGVNTQLYWHTTAPKYTPLTNTPENRLYISQYRVDDFIKSFLSFSKGHVVSDRKIDAAYMGQKQQVREVELESTFGKTQIFVTNGQLNYPFGLEKTGYAVKDLTTTLDKALSSGAKVLWQSTQAEAKHLAMVQFPGGYIAEIHQI